MNRMLSFLGMGYVLRFMFCALVVLLLTLCFPPIPIRADLGTDFIEIGTTVMDTRSIAWGDWDSDGDLDLALGNWGQPNQVYRNNGDAGFSLAWESTGDESRTTDVAWGDWDGDGDLDLAVGNGCESPYLDCDPNLVYENDAGTFVLIWKEWEEFQPMNTRGTTSVAWGDWNGDGYLDLAVGKNGNVNKVYENTGGYLVSTWESTGYLSATTSVAWGDWDGDGDLDLAFGNDGEVNQVWENDGGNLTLAWESTGDASRTTGVSWGDWDGDGDLDLAIGNSEQAEQVYRNDSGNLSLAWSSTPDTRDTTGVAWGDWDGDGDLDLAIANAGEANQVYRNNGGNLSLAWESTDDNSTSDVAWGDWDGDGDLDLAVGIGYRDNLSRIYKNKGKLLALDPSAGYGWESTGVLSETQSVTWGDWDGDGDLDLAIGNSNAVNQVYENDGDSLSLAWESTGYLSATTSVAWGDWDKDGDLDLAMGNSGETNQVYRNDGGNLSLAWESTGVLSGTQSVAWGDWDGDKDLDLAMGNYGEANQVFENYSGTLKLNPGAGYGWESTGEAKDTTSVAWGDWDGDGDLDLAVGNWDDVNQVYENDRGNISLAWESTGNERFTEDVAWGDWDGDGDLDLAVGNGCKTYTTPYIYSVCHTNQVYETEGKNLSLAWESLGDRKPTTSVAWGDWDGDGDLDLAVGNGYFPLYGHNQVYENEGGSLSLAWESTSGLTNDLTWGDWDGDGDLDLAVGNWGEVNQVYENPRLGGDYLANNPPGAVVHRPGATRDAFFHSTPQILESSTLPITYTLFDPGFDPVRQVQGYYSLNGGGQWFPAVVTNTTTISLATGGGMLTRQASAGLPWPIPDLGTITAMLSITSAYEIADLDVWLAITHTWDSDLDVYLRSPSGTLVELFTDVGGSGDNFDYTVLSDQASTSITTGTAPFAGDYRPEGSLAALNGETTSGTWALIVTDDAGGDTGTLIAWGLRIKTAPVAHIYTWDTFASGVFGQSDDVVFRLDVHGGGGGPFQRAKTTVYSPPFRVRGMQVQVYSETAVDGNEAAGALVYRRNENVGSSLMVDSVGIPLYTDQNGYLQGRGQIGLGDQLLAMLPVSTVAEYAGTLTFDSVDDYAIKNPFNSAPVTETTIAFWISTTQTTDSTLFSYATPGAYDALRIAKLGNITLYRGSTSRATGIAVNDGLWHHLAVTWRSSDGQVLLYKDGTAVYTGTLALGTTIAPGGSLVLGQDQDSVGGGFQSAEAFQGTLDEVEVWNKNLTPAEILEAMYGWVGEDATGLAAAWTFDDPEDPGTDTSGNDNHLTLYGATWDGDYLGGYTVYHTNGTPTANGVDAFTVISPGVQEITVTAQHPLVLFDLNVSLEWDAHNDPLYLQQLEIDLQRASAHLYDFTNGQVALGHVTVYQNADYWASSHIAVQATNHLRPFASIGGLPLDIFTETVTVDGQEHTLTYGPGQIRMGATWNRYGDPGQSIGEDWPLILAHELSHYLLYQYDVYIGLNENDLLVPVDTCTGSAMGDVYALANTEFITDTLHWTTACSQTLAAKTLGRTEWETLRLHYPWLITPTLANPGPSKMPFAFTTVEILSPTTAVDTLEDPTFYLDYEDGGVSSSEARAFLLRDADNVALPSPDDYEYIYDLGSPIGGQNRLLARGARPGDRLCVFDGGRAHFGCEIVTATDEELFLASDPTWQPYIQLSPVNSTTFTLTVQLDDAVALKARLYPEFGSAFDVTDLAYDAALGAYTGTLALPYPALVGHVQVWVDEPAPRRETIIAYSIGGNPGTSRIGGIGTSRIGGIGTSRIGGIGTSRIGGIGGMQAGEAPAVSSDGQMILYTSDVITFAEGQFFTIQAMPTLPDPPPGRTAVGQGYNLVATTGTPVTGSVSIQYMGSDALVAGVYDENDLDIYFWDGNTWTMLDTELSPYFNIASAECQGTGLYALMGSIKLPLYGPGWNLISYPVRTPQTVPQALLSISGTYTTVYGYAADDPSDPWKVYDVTVPEWLRPVVNDLTVLEFGHGYWINVSQAITLYLSSSAMTLEPTSLQATLPLPPATFYGTIDASTAWMPAAGMPVTAWIDGTLCGQTSTREVDGHVVYAVNLFADDLRAGCGAPGKRVVFQVDGRTMAPSASWDDRQLWPVALRPGWQVYLPLIVKPSR